MTATRSHYLASAQGPVRQAPEHYRARTDATAVYFQSIIRLIALHLVLHLVAVITMETLSYEENTLYLLS